MRARLACESPSPFEDAGNHRRAALLFWLLQSPTAPAHFSRQKSSPRPWNKAVEHPSERGFHSPVCHEVASKTATNTAAFSDKTTSQSRAAARLHLRRRRGYKSPAPITSPAILVRTHFRRAQTLLHGGLLSPDCCGCIGAPYRDAHGRARWCQNNPAAIARPLSQ